jgi:hypothetical protein
MDDFIYIIDKDDKITSVSKNWDSFATNNEGPQCLLNAIEGQSIFDFINDKETAHLYQLLIESVRSNKKDITVPINCDSPSLKRLINIDMKYMSNGSIAFITRVVKLEERDPCEILDCNIDRSDKSVKICSFCKKVNIDDKWILTELAVKALKLFEKEKLPSLTHGICPQCYDNAMAKIK